MAVGDLVANLTANTAGFSRGLNSARSSLGGFSSGIISQLSTIGLAFQGLRSIGSVFRGIGGNATGMVQLAAEAEQTAVSFEVMLGSADKATTMIAQMRQFAAATPLETKDIQDAGKTLLQFGVDGNNVMPMLRMLGDVTGGNSERFSRMALAFGQVSAAGRLQGQDLLQMINAGFNPLKIISEQTGKSMADLKKQMEDGGISTQMVVSAFQAATAAGGQFSGMMDRQSKTTSGLFSTLKDNVSLAMMDIGRALIEGFNLNGLMADTSAFLEMFRGQWLPGIVQGITTLGGSFGMLYQSIRTGWGQWIGETIGLAVEFFANWDLYLAIAWENVALFGANTVERFRTMFVNAGELLTWFSGNWQDVLFTIGDYAMTVFINIGQNLRDIWSGVLDFIAGRGFSFDPTPLTEGFKSAISEMPQLTEAAVNETTPALEGLYANLAERQAAMAQKLLESSKPSDAIPEGMSPFDSSAKTDGDSANKQQDRMRPLTAAMIGSQEAASMLLRGVGGGKTVEQIANKQLTVQQQILAATKANRLPDLVPVSFGAA